MKSSFLYWVNLLVISIFAFGTTGCSDDDNKNEIYPPSLTLEAGETTETTVSFTMIPKHADEMAYLLVKKEATAPSLDQIFSEGTNYAATENAKVTVKDLERNTKYQVYAASKSGELKSEVASLELQTGDYTQLITLLEKGKNYYSYHIKTTAANTPVLHLGVEKDLLDFFLEDLTDETEIEAMKQDILVNFGYHGAGEKTYTLKDGEIDPDNNATLEVLAGIPQVILAVETDAEGNVTGKTSMIEFTTETPGTAPYNITIEVFEIKPTTARIICTPEQGIIYFYQVLFKKEVADQFIAEKGADAFRAYILNSGDRCDEGIDDFVWTKLSPDTDYVMYLIGIDANGDQVQVNKEFRTGKEASGDNIVLDRALKVLYWPGNYYVEFGDCEMAIDADNRFYPADGGAGNWVVIDCYGSESTDPNHPIFPTGTYTLDPNNTFATGTCSQKYTWANSWDAAGTVSSIDFASGSITVTQNGGNYQITMQFVSDEGTNFKCSYNGPLTFAAGASLSTTWSKFTALTNGSYRFSRDMQTHLNVLKHQQHSTSAVSIKEQLKAELKKK